MTHIRTESVKFDAVTSPTTAAHFEKSIKKTANDKTNAAEHTPSHSQSSAREFTPKASPKSDMGTAMWESKQAFNTKMQDRIAAQDIKPIVGTDGADRLNGTRQNDRINGKGGDDVVNGGGGNDSLIGGEGNDTISGGGVWDQQGPFNVPQPWGENTMRAGSGDDLIFGQAGGSRFGLAADRDGDDRIYGGSGNDTVVYYGTAGQFTVTRQGNEYHVVDSRTGKKDVMTGVENLRFDLQTADYEGVIKSETFKIKDLVTA